MLIDTSVPDDRLIGLKINEVESFKGRVLQWCASLESRNQCKGQTAQRYNM